MKNTITEEKIKLYLGMTEELIEENMLNSELRRLLASTLILDMGYEFAEDTKMGLMVKKAEEEIPLMRAEDIVNNTLLKITNEWRNINSDRQSIIKSAVKIFNSDNIFAVG